MATRTILLVDPDPDSRAIYSLILRHAGFQVLCALDGEQGYRLAREASPDVVIVEVFAPRIDGKRLTELLKDDESTSRIPVVVFTVLPEVVSGGWWPTRADAHLSKPCEPTRLLREVQRLLEPPEALVF